MLQGWSKLALPSQSSAAPFAARLRIARERNSGLAYVVFESRVVCGTTGFDFRRERQFSRPARSRTRFPDNFHPELHDRALLSGASKGAALLSGDALFAGINLDRSEACCVST